MTPQGDDWFEEDDIPEAPPDDRVTPSLLAALGRMFMTSPEPKGLLGKIMDITRRTDQGRAGRPHAAVGVAASTWNRWVLAARGFDGGSRPNAASELKLTVTVRSTRHKDPSYERRSKLRIKNTIIWWNGYLNATPKRSTTLDIGPKDGDPFKAARDAWFAGHDQLAGELFLQALEDEYGVPIDLEDVGGLELWE